MDSFQNGAISRTVLPFSVPAHSASFKDLRLMPLTPGNRPHSFCVAHSPHLPPLHVLSSPRMPSHDCLSCGALALVVTTGITWCPSGCDSTLCIPPASASLALTRAWHHRTQEMLPAQERTRGTPLQHSTLGKLNHSPSLPRQPSPVPSAQGCSSVGGLCSWR